MPVKVSNFLPAKKILEAENIFVMDESRAMTQDIRPLRIAVLNLMPLKEDTELQLLRSFSNTPLQIEVTFLTTASYVGTNTPLSHLEQFYMTFEDVKHKKFDGLIITGAPVEQMEFEEVAYWEELKQIMDITVTNRQVQLRPILTGEDIVAMRRAIRDIPIADPVAEYALKVVVATHPEVEGATQHVKRYVSCGASPRAAQAIYQTARAKALLENRFNVSFDDIKSVAYPALRHRLGLSFEALADGVTADEIIEGILSTIKVG